MNRFFRWATGILTAAVIAYATIAPKFNVVKNNNSNTYQMGSRNFPSLQVNYTPKNNLLEVKGQITSKNYGTIDNRLFFDFDNHDKGFESKTSTGLNGSIVYNDDRNDWNLEAKKNNTGIETTLDNNAADVQGQAVGKRLWSFNTPNIPSLVDRAAFTTSNYGSLEYLRGKGNTSYII